MRGSRKKFQKTPFWSFLAKKGHFGQFLAKTVKIIKKALGTFFSRLQAQPNYKVSESSEWFPKKKCYACTRVRTDATPMISNNRWSREQKKKNK